MSAGLGFLLREGSSVLLFFGVLSLLRESPPGAPRQAVTFLLAQESNQRMPWKLFDRASEPPSALTPPALGLDIRSACTVPAVGTSAPRSGSDHAQQNPVRRAHGAPAETKRCSPFLAERDTRRVLSVKSSVIFLPGLALPYLGASMGLLPRCTLTESRDPAQAVLMRPAAHPLGQITS